MDVSIPEETIANSVYGMNFVRPPTLEFIKVDETKDYIEYEVLTKKLSAQKDGDNVFTNYLDSFIYCNETIKIKQPKKEFMIKKMEKENLLML